MDLRNITDESTLLKSYKTIFVDNQSYESIKSYRDKQGRFPIFTDRVFAASAGSVNALVDYKYREKLDESKVGKVFVLERIDNPNDASKTRLFVVWISPKLLERFRTTASDKCLVSVNVIFHPRASLEKYPTYWKGDLDPVKLPNYLELGFRYLCKEKYSILQHLCAVGPSADVGQGPGLTERDAKLEIMVVAPVSNPSSYSNLSAPSELQDALSEISKRCYEGAGSPKLVGALSPVVNRVAVSGYSRSGMILSSLLNPGGESPFLRDTLKEVYAFDVMLDEKDKEGKTIKTKQQGYEEFWTKLKKWQGDDSGKKIRLYSAETATVANIYSELKSNLQKYGGGYHNPAAAFSKFNKTAVPGTSSVYSGLSDAYEIYSTDNSRSLVALPSNNSLVYLSTENIKNSGGFQPGGDYEPDLEGHSWFVSRLQSHALFHSGL
jgi:hypothetical protein